MLYLTLWWDPHSYLNPKYQVAHSQSVAEEQFDAAPEPAVLLCLWSDLRTVQTLKTKGDVT